MIFTTPAPAKSYASPRIILRLPAGDRVPVPDGFRVFDVPEHTTIAALGAKGRPLLMTHWSPSLDVVGPEACVAAVDAMIARLGGASVEVLQYRVWNYEESSYLTNLYHLSLLQKDGKIKTLGVEHMDLLHLRMLKASGYDIAMNTVSMSVLDRRAETGGLAAWCHDNGVQLLGTGVLLGGFVSESWIGQSEPSFDQLTDEMKQYKRFIDAAGGWDAFLNLLVALMVVSGKHHVPLSAVAVRYVLDIPGVAAVVIGAEETKDTGDFFKASTIKLDDADRKTIADAQGHLTPIKGDCGDEYRYPPYLTPSGALDHPFVKEQQKRKAEVERLVREGERVEVSSGSPWEPVCGYCRGVRIGNTFEVAGTTTRAHPSGVGVIGGASVADQTTHVMDIIAAAVRGVGASMSDITRTRVFIKDVAHWRGVAEVHGATMRHHGIRPVNTMVGGNTLIGDGILVEVEAMGIVRA